MGEYYFEQQKNILLTNAKNNEVIPILDLETVSSNKICKSH